MMKVDNTPKVTYRFSNRSGVITVNRKHEVMKVNDTPKATYLNNGHYNYNAKAAVALQGYVGYTPW